jgi:predicted RNA-binding protein with TRAM domain
MAFGNIAAQQNLNRDKPITPYSRCIMRNSNTNPPVSVGDEINVRIESLGEKGDGVAKINGFVIFVKNVSQGDNLKIKVTKVLSKVGFGDVIEKLGDGEASEHPSEPKPKKEKEEKHEKEPSDGDGSYEVSGSHEHQEYTNEDQ